MSSALIKPRARSLVSPDLVMPAFTTSATAKKGMTLVDLRSLGIIPMVAGGAPGGFNQASDLVTQTVDGFDLNDLWTEYQTTMALQNQERQTLVDFLTFTVTNPQERVPQISSADFEKASQYGEPRGIRPSVAQWKLGYDFDWYDLAARFTWKFLAEAPRAQVDAINAMAIEADNRLVFKKVMQALFTNVNREADIDGNLDVPVYALYNGDGTVPPTYKSHTFDGNHNHYLTSGAATIDSVDVDDMYEHLRHHGYSSENGMRIVALMNSREVKVARTWRTTLGDSWDFIPAAGSPAQLVDREALILGSQVNATLEGLNVVGTYGPVIIVEEDMIPAGYVPMIATGGRANLNNPVGIREHSNTSLRGLRLVKGANPDYPLIDSFYNRGFGTGIRHRGGSVVMQITASASYTPPSVFAL